MRDSFRIYGNLFVEAVLFILVFGKSLYLRLLFCYLREFLVDYGLSYVLVDFLCIFVNFGISEDYESWKTEKWKNLWLKEVYNLLGSYDLFTRVDYSLF
jgi:hypothetical protein